MKKRILRLLLVVVMACVLVSALCGCKGKTIIQNGSDTKVAIGYKEAVSQKQNFSTRCLDCYDTLWDDEDGLYIYTENSNSIPYVLIYKFSDMPVDAKQFLEESILTNMQDTYGDNLIETGELKDYTLAGESIPGILFTYKVDDNTVNSLRLCKQEGDDIINFTAKYLEDEGQTTMDALEDAIKYFQPNVTSSDDNKKEVTVPNVNKDKVSIVLSEAAQITYETYSDPNGYFTIEIPKGWVVKVGLLGYSDEIDLISYGIQVYDSNNPDRMLYYNLNCAGMVKSQEAHDWYVKYYGSDNLFAQMPIVSSSTTEGFFQGMSEIYGYSDFSTLENLGETALGGDLLTANCTSVSTGKKLEGLFTATIMDSPYLVQKDMLNYAAGTVDAGYLTAFTIIMETAPEEEFLDWQPILDHCLSTIQFTDTFQSQRQAQWKQVLGTSSYISQTADEISGMIMDSWEYRNKTYDVSSQKRSDATLGYERVYDTETDEYYKAESGFGDWYDGRRYQVVDDDNAYLSPISGYIDWK